MTRSKTFVNYNSSGARLNSTYTGRAAHHSLPCMQWGILGFDLFPDEIISICPQLRYSACLLQDTITELSERDVYHVLHCQC